MPSFSEIPSRILSMSLETRNYNLLTSRETHITPLRRYPRREIHIRRLIIPRHLLAQDRAEKVNPNPGDLLHGHLIEDVHKQDPCDELHGTDDQQPHQIRQRVCLYRLPQLVVGRIRSGSQIARGKPLD